jgi:predicted Zn-dependent protease
VAQAIPLTLGLALALVLGTVTYQRSRLYVDPEALYRDGIAKIPGNSRAYDNLADFLQRRPSRVPDAIALYRQAVSIDSNDVVGWDGLAQILMDQHQYAEGRQIVERLLKSHPDVPHLYDLLGVAVGAQESPEAAIPYLEKSIGTGRDAQAFNDLGIMYAAADRWPEAMAALKRALAIDPTRAATASYLGYLLTADDKAGEAVPYLEDAARRDTASAVNRARLALAYSALNRPRDAAVAAAAALARAKDEGRVYSIAGMALMGANYPNEAIAALTRAVELDPTDDGARQALAALRKKR